MGIEIPHRDFACDPGIMHRKSRVQITDSGVPGDGAITDRRGNHGGADGFGHGGELENGIRVNALRFSRFAHAESFGENDFVAENDGDGDSRDFAFSHCLGDNFGKFFHGGFHAFRGEDWFGCERGGEKTRGQQNHEKSHGRRIPSGTGFTTPGRNAPEKPHSQYLHNRTGEDNADAHLKRTLMGREAVAAVTGGKLDFGPWEQIFYGEFDGRRRKRVLVKIIGE